MLYIRRINFVKMSTLFQLKSINLMFLQWVTLGFSSVQFSCSVVSDSLWPHELQHARPPCPSPTPRVDPNPCPLNPWCHPAISSSVIPFSSGRWLLGFRASWQEGSCSMHVHVCAKSLQSCLTLCEPMDYSLSGFSIHGIL